MAILRRLAAAALLLMLLNNGAAAQTEQRVALVVGNSNYLSVVKLRNPVNDATAMSATLRRAGFEVIERENVSRRELIEATRVFAKKLAPGGVGLFFYAGHGIQAQGANYLVPIDANLAVEDDLKYETLDLQDILNKLDDARVRLSIVILDACRDNPFTSFRSNAGGLAMINPPAGTIIAYATAPGKVARDGDGDNGIFTAALLRAMNKPDKLLDVFEHVTEAVERQTGNQQTPWINSSFRGDFYFTGPTTVTIAPAPAPAPVATPSLEVVFWQSIAGSTNPADFEAYLQQFPQGSFVTLARNRLASLATQRGAAQPPAALDRKPPEVKHALTPSVPPGRQKLAAVDPTNPQTMPAAPLASPANSEPHRAQPVHPAPSAPPAVVGAPRPKRTEPSAGVSAEAAQAAVPPAPGPVAPTQEALARSPSDGAARQLAPQVVQPGALVPEKLRPGQRRATAGCRVPYSAGVETGAGAYVTIRVVNTGIRCGGRVQNRNQPTEYTLAVSKAPSHGSVTIEGNAYYYTPFPDYAGSDDFAIVTNPWGKIRAVVTVLPPDSGR